MTIHETAIVEGGAEIGNNVIVGPFCRVGGKARLRDGVVLVSHVVIDGVTDIGRGTEIHPFCVLGGAPQHVGDKGEGTSLVIGANNVIREHVTMNRGTVAGRGETQIGDNGMFMTGAHVGHDCIVGNKVIFANNATLGGHVKVGDGVFLGGLCAIHQNGRIGPYAFIGGCAAVTSDIIPYASVIGNHAYLAGLNVVGMKRRGMDRTTIHALRSAYKVLFNDKGAFKDRVIHAKDQFGHLKEAQEIINFIEYDASRALMMPMK